LKDPATFTEAHKEASRIHELTKSKIYNGCSFTSVVEQKGDTINQIKGNGTQNPYCGNYCGLGGQGLGAPKVHCPD